jgi:hypothetical protein
VCLCESKKQLNVLLPTPKMPESRSIAEVEKFLLSVMGFNRAFPFEIKKVFLLSPFASSAAAGSRPGPSLSSSFPPPPLA